MSIPMPITLYLFLGWNAFVYLLYGLDKRRAKRGARRIPEFWLISLAFLMGSLGALFGMIHFNHKTKKMKFRLLVPFAFWVNVAVAWLTCFWSSPD